MSQADKDWAAKRKKLDEAVEALSEFFDTVQIFVTEYRGDDGGSTFRSASGSGNYFARFGQVSLWAKREANEDLKDKED